MGSMLLFLMAATIAIASPLQPAAPHPPTHHTTASTIPDPPPEVDPFQPSLLDDFFLAAFRWTLQKQTDGPRSDLPGFEGMAEELIEFRQLYGLDAQERASSQTLVALSGPVPFVYRQLFASADYSPALLAWFAKHLLPWLVGDMELTQRSVDDPRGGGVLITRCRVLEGTNCKGVCTKMCKIPTQNFFAEQWGVPLSMTPNFETGECQMAFGTEPLPVDQDPTIPSGCLTRCPAASAFTRTQPPELLEGQTEEANALDVC